VKPQESAPHGVRLAALAKAVAGAEATGAGQAAATSLAYDSRRVQSGALFFALPGVHTDGRLHAEEAVRRGAVGVVHEDGLHGVRGAATIRVPDARRAMGEMAAVFYGHPSRRLRVTGVTGTNGKTTTVFLLRDILRRAGIPTGLVGTIVYEYGGRRIAAGRTTPESPDLQCMMAESLQAGDAALVMEASSQGLAAERLRGTRCAAAVFTNLTPDHLDAHGTMEVYFSAKKALFDLLAEDAPAVVNLDDEYGRRLAATPELAGRVIGCGEAADAAVRATDVRLTETGTDFRAETPWGEADIRLPLPGRFNVANALAALAAGGAQGAAPEAMAEALANCTPVPGRLERIEDPAGGRHVFVDYAHTEDALRNVLRTLRETAPGRLVCVFGCGGDRDRGKRPRMGAAAAEWADVAVVTSDNPRGEEPDAIIREIVAGMEAARDLRVEPDRAAAIRLALRATRAGDTLLVAGKGHETVQETAGRVQHFDDREVVRAALAEI